jgi:hypothetical protein
VVPTYRLFALVGSTTIDEIERALVTAGLPGSSDQVVPPSVDL